MKKISLYVVLTFVALTSVNSTIFAQEIIDTFFGNNSGSKFGWSVDLTTNAELLAIGAPESNNIGDLVNTLNDRGAVYVYSKEAEGYELKGQILGGDDQGDIFGWSTAISDNGDLVVGSRFDSDDHTAGGNVKVFHFDEGTSRWVLEQNFPSRQDNEQFGWAVDITDDGEFMIASAVTHSYDPDVANGGVGGIVRVYKQDNNAWSQCSSSIMYPGAGTSVEFGYDVSIRKVTVGAQDVLFAAISAQKEVIDGEARGAVRVYSIDLACNNGWSLVHEPLNGTHFDQWYGESIDLNSSEEGIFLAVGAGKTNTDQLNTAGSVEVYQYTNDAWVQYGTTIFGTQESQRLGHSVSIVRDRLAIGSSQFNEEGGFVNHGKIDVYQFKTDDWKQSLEPLVGPSPNSYLGSSIGFDGTYLLAGAPYNSIVGNNYGMAAIGFSINYVDIDSVESNIQVSGDNQFLGELIVHFNQPVWGDADMTSPASLNNFDVNFSFLANNQMFADAVSITNIDGDPLTGGEEVIKFAIKYVDGLPVSQDEVVITLNQNITLYDAFGFPVRQDLEGMYEFGYLMSVPKVSSPVADQVYTNGSIPVFVQPAINANAHRYTIVEESFDADNPMVVADEFIVMPETSTLVELNNGDYEIQIQALYVANLDNEACAGQVNGKTVINDLAACEVTEGPLSEPTAFTMLSTIVSPIVSSPTDDSYVVDSLHFILDEDVNSNFHHIMIVARDSTASTEQYRYLDRVFPYTGEGLNTTFYWGWQGTFDVYVRNIFVENTEDPECIEDLGFNNGVYEDYYFDRDGCVMTSSEWTGPISIDGYVSLDDFPPYLYLNAQNNEVTTPKVELGYLSYQSQQMNNYEFTNAHRLQVVIDSFNVESPEMVLDTVIFSKTDTLSLDLELGQYEFRAQGLTFIDDGNENCTVREGRTPVELIDITECTLLEGPFTTQKFTRAEAVSSEFNEELPNRYALSQNYPNPFNPSTSVEFSIPEATQVRLDVFNSVGQLVQTLVNEQRSAGQHTVRFNASGLSSGVYLYKITTPNFSMTKKMLLMK